jgi:Tetratricopeptide repeat.
MTAEEWFKRGTNLEKQNDFIGAIAAYKKAIDIDSKYEQAYFRKGGSSTAVSAVNALAHLASEQFK